jgi:hypothetical protein
MKNFHRHMRNVKEEMNNQFGEKIETGDQIQALLNIPDGSKGDSPNVLSLLSSAGGIAGTVVGLGSGGAAAPVSAGISAISGVFSILSTFDSSR